MNKTIAEFLTYIKIPVSESYCERLIASHADFPSLLSIVDSLERLGIRHVVGRIEKEKINDLSFPYVVQLNKRYGEILTIKNKKDLITHEEDLKHWDGVVLQVVPTMHVLDEENNKLYQKERFFKSVQNVLLTVGAILLLWSASLIFSPISIALFVTAILGIVVGYLLVAKELGVKYKVVESFCTSGKNTDCDKILSSNDAKLFGEVKLSDAVLTYFVFQTIFLAVSGYLPAIESFIFFSLSIFSFLLIPVVVYSIYYQYVKAKSWCRLCLVVDGILVIQAFLFGYLSTNFNGITIHYDLVLFQAMVFIVIGGIILLFKSRIEVANNLSKILPPAARIKNNAQVFTHLLLQQKNVIATLMEHEVLMGNVNAPIKIVMVSNLFCNPCKDQHEVADQLINTFSDKVNIALRFVVSKNGDSNHYLIQYWFRFIHLKADESLNTQKLIHDWYTMMDLDKFKKKYPMEILSGLEISEDIEKRHAKWIELQAIPRTPTFFVNGYEMPKGYELNDLISFIPTLADELKILKPTQQSAFATT